MFCRHCGAEVPSGTPVKFCPKCGSSLSGDYPSDIQRIAKLAKFNSSSETLFQTCISSLTDLGITLNKIDRETNYIETAPAARMSPISSYSSFPVIKIRVAEGESSAESIIRASINTVNMETATTSFDKLISAISSRLNQKPTAVEDGIMDDIEERKPLVQGYPARKKEGTKNIPRGGSIVLGIIVGIWTVILVAIVIEYNLRLANASENASGFGMLVIVRVAPSIEISTIVALLFIVMTILLFVRPRKGTTVALVVLSVVNML